jgi:carboxypeptidase Taq
MIVSSKEFEIILTYEPCSLISSQLKQSTRHFWRQPLHHSDGNKTPYQQLEDRMARISAISGACEMLHWDMSAMMPSGGYEARTEQLTALNAIAHNQLTAKDMPDLLDAADADTSLNSWQMTNLKEIRQTLLKATALSESLVEALTRASAACEEKWRAARPDNDYASILPELNTLLDLVRETGQAKADVLGLDLHDAMLDDFEPGGRVAEIDILFDDLSAFLPEFIGQVLEHQASKPVPIMPKGPFPIEKQQTLGKHFMKTLGFDFDHGRLDVSLHPFCGGVPDDVRITTRYDEEDFTSALMGILHETGHALYERGLPKEWRTQPVGQSLGMSTHESQSLLIEMQVCRSAAFLEYASPIMKETMGGSGPMWETDNLLRLYSNVKPDFIRVDADEVTYPAHVILRHRIEKSVISGNLLLQDLPGAWNDGMEELLGITPPDDRLGCLQDVHWYDGAWGYFPTYTLGAMTAAQLYHAAKQQDSSIEAEISKGNFAPLLTWLRKNVHSKGRSVTPQGILIEATGAPLNAEIFKNHLKTRYLS